MKIDPSMVYFASVENATTLDMAIRKLERSYPKLLIYSDSTVDELYTDFNPLLFKKIGSIGEKACIYRGVLIKPIIHAHPHVETVCKYLLHCFNMKTGCNGYILVKDEKIFESICTVSYTEELEKIHRNLKLNLKDMDKKKR